MFTFRGKSLLASLKLNDRFWYITFLIIWLKNIIFFFYTVNSSNLLYKSIFIIAWILMRIPYYWAFVGVLIAFALLLKNKPRFWFLIIFNLFVSIILLINLWYYRGFNTLPTIYVLQQTSNLDNLSQSIFSLIHLRDLIFLIDIPLLIFIALKRKYPSQKKDRQKLTFAIIFILSFCLISYSPITGSYNSAYELADLNTTSRNLSPLGCNIFNTYIFFRDLKPLKLGDEQKSEIETWFKEKKENLPDNKYKSLFKGKNLILIQVESLEKFIIQQKVEGQEITPNLNKMLANSLYFSNIYEQVNQGTSSDSDLIINTSVYPLRWSSTFFRYPNTTYNSLPKLMRNRGYSTVAIHPIKSSFWNWVPALKSIGFEKCIDSSKFVLDDTFNMGLTDESNLRQAESMLRQQKQPFYSFVVTMSSHMPYDFPKKYKELSLSNELDETALGGYFQAIHYADKQIGTFLTNLKRDGLLDNSVVVVYGDHEGIHKYYYDNIQKMQPYENWWLENNKQIPLIIYQNQLQGEKLEITGGQIDIMPTIAYLMGVEDKEYEQTAIGRNLLKTNKNFAVLNSGVLVGDTNNQKDNEHAVKGLSLADIIVKSDYFNKDEK